MKIAKVETIAIKVPFTFGGQPFGWGGKVWNTNDILLVRVETDTGIVGWGEAFCYACLEATQAAVEHMIAPMVIGRDAGDIAGMSRYLQQGLHLQGRYGITIFAVSGLDIALWDIAGKAMGVPVHRLLGGAGRSELPGYASLFKYRNAEQVAARTKMALDQGYKYIKLHETTEPEVRAAREVAGSGIPIMVDTNCPWTPEEARHMTRRLMQYDLHWLEEPIFPPEDFLSLARLRREEGVALAAGENACTAMEFAQMLRAEAVDYVQPSVTKVGGISEFQKVAALADAAGVTVMPHSPYFGPGFLATLHLAAARATPGALIERFHMDLEASIYGKLIDAVNGFFKVPQQPGLGPEPDADVIKTYRVK
jgi:L-alanine-DL-glutamate epimerase-like enolase superfamily enzyme